MKMMIVVALALVAVAVAAPTEPIKILRSESEQSPEGAFSYSYETENKIKAQATGELKEALDEDNKPHSVVVIRGSYSYINDEGHEETINYYADETGYHAEGPSIPKGPVARR